MIIDYSQLDSSIRNTVSIIENKPHVRYIRYLLTKRYSPIVIKKELQRLGLSAPHEKPLVKYYLAVIDPLVKAYGLGPVYADYKNKLLRKNKQHSFHKHLLNYKLHLGDEPDTQIKFCKFITELEVDSIWVSEIMRFYGSAANVPLDENGERIIKTTSYKRKLDTILTSPKRYLIDKMILESVPDRRIADYCRKNLKIPVYDYDIAQYKQVFFNLRTYDIEDKIKTLEVERKSLESFLEIIDNDDDMGLGEKINTKEQTKKRIKELDENVKSLNMLYTESAFAQAKLEQDNFAEMFRDVVFKSYQRFSQLDNYKDRDVVDPLFKVVKMMGYAHDKVNEIILQKANAGDKHAQFELIKLYRDRADEMYKQQIDDANKMLEQAGEHIINNDTIDIDAIHGIEELNIMANDDECDEELES